MADRNMRRKAGMREVMADRSIQEKAEVMEAGSMQEKAGTMETMPDEETQGKIMCGPRILRKDMEKHILDQAECRKTIKRICRRKMREMLIRIQARNMSPTASACTRRGLVMFRYMTGRFINGQI